MPEPHISCEQWLKHIPMEKCYGYRANEAPSQSLQSSRYSWRTILLSLSGDIEDSPSSLQHPRYRATGWAGVWELNQRADASLSNAGQLTTDRHLWAHTRWEGASSTLLPWWNTDYCDPLLVTIREQGPTTIIIPGSINTSRFPKARRLSDSWALVLDCGRRLPLQVFPLKQTYCI